MFTKKIERNTRKRDREREKGEKEETAEVGRQGRVRLRLIGEKEIRSKESEI